MQAFDFVADGYFGSIPTASGVSDVKDAAEIGVEIRLGYEVLFFVIIMIPKAAVVVA